MAGEVQETPGSRRLLFCAASPLTGASRMTKRLINDEKGESHAARVIENLAPVAREIRVLRLPGLPDRGDVSDWLEAGGTADELAKLMEAAPKLDDAPALAELIVSSAEFIAGFVPP